MADEPTGGGVLGIDHGDRPLLGLLLRLLHQHWADGVDGALREAGFRDIRPPHANVFPFVPADGIQVSELAKLARVRKQSMADAVDQLERAGYVERHPDPSDRRARLVFLTKRGKAVRPVGVGAGKRVEEHWAQLTSEREIESLRRSLTRLLTALAEQGAQPDQSRSAPKRRRSRRPAQ